MSTCPDSDLYSAFIDGEVPSPWKEKLEAHVNSCPKCRKQTEKYQKIHALLSAGTDKQPAYDFEASFQRIAERRKECIASMGKKIPNNYLAWTRQSVKIPITAFAALFLAAVFLPAFFIIKTTAGSKSAQSELSMQNASLQAIAANGYQNKHTLSSFNQVYSPDLTSKVLQAQPVSSSQKTVFTMVDFARQFAANQDLFSDADIIIIKMPKLTSFSGTENQFQSTGKPLLQAAGFYK